MSSCSQVARVTATASATSRPRSAGGMSGSGARSATIELVLAADQARPDPVPHRRDSHRTERCRHPVLPSWDELTSLYPAAYLVTDPASMGSVTPVM